MGLRRCVVALSERFTYVIKGGSLTSPRLAECEAAEKIWLNPCRFEKVIFYRNFQLGPPQRVSSLVEARQASLAKSYTLFTHP